MESILAILVLLLALLAVVICITKPKYAIVPVLLLFPAEQILMGYVPDLRWRFSWAVNVVVGLVALFAVGGKVVRGERVFKGSGNPVTWLVFGYFAWVAVSVLWSPAPDSAVYFLRQNWPYFILLYAITPLLAKDLDDLTCLNVPLIFVGAILMALLLINPNARFINDRYVIDMGYQAGFGEIASNPLAIADAGAMLAITAAVYRPSSPRPVLALLKWGSILLGLTLALLSGSRGQVMAGVAIIAIFAPMSLGTKSALRVAGSFIVVGVAVLFLMYVFQNFVIGAAQDRWGGGDRSNGLGERWDMATTLLGAYASSPAFWVTGLGASAFNAIYTYRPDNLDHWYPHNIVVESLAEYGVVGFAMLMTMLVLTAKACFRLLRFAGPDGSRRSTVVVFAAIATFNMLMSMKQGSTLGMPGIFMFCLIISRVERNESERVLALEYDQEQYGEPEQNEYEDGAPEPA